MPTEAAISAILDVVQLQEQTGFRDTTAEQILGYCLSLLLF